VGRRGKEREGEGRRRGMERKGERRSGKEREGALIYEPLIYLIYIVQTKYIPLIYENVRPHFLI
jgi:hypothetical protein